jgi:hypothetical protein
MANSAFLCSRNNFLNAGWLATTWGGSHQHLAPGRLSLTFTRILANRANIKNDALGRAPRAPSSFEKQIHVKCRLLQYTTAIE